MKDQFELIDELSGMRDKFNQDPEVKELVLKLKSKIEELEAKTFSEEERESDEFTEMCDMFYHECRESKPDEVEVFDILWIHASYRWELTDND